MKVGKLQEDVLAQLKRGTDEILVEAELLKNSMKGDHYALKQVSILLRLIYT